jgi:hypothetical protein
MQATRDPGLASLAAGARGAEYPGLMPFDTAASEPLRSLALTPILPRNDAVVLERSGSRVAVAARRLERGRVLTFGYHDIWRWRMSGSDGAAQAHRDWWADLVSLVAQAGRVPVSDDVLTDEAPRAALAARLGSPGKGPADAPGPRWPGDPLLFGVALAALFSEWMSRRLRGAV